MSLAAPIFFGAVGSPDHAASALAPVSAAARTVTIAVPGAPAKEDVDVRTSDSLELRGTFYAPKRKKNDSTPAPGVLLVHDAGGDRAQLEEVALKLQKSGFGVLSIDLRGHGESKDKAGTWDELDDDQRSRAWALATRDVEAAGEWLLSKEDVHSTNLSLVGLGSGCALAVRHAKRDENVRCVVLLAPNNKKDFGFDVASDLLKLEGLPTLVLAEKDDDDTKAMVAEANDGTSPYVELAYAAARVANVIEDRKMPGKVSTWMKGNAMPKRGRS